MNANIIRIAQFEGGKQGLNQRQAIEAANQRKLNLLTNKQFDKRVVLTDTWRGEMEVYPAWTGTMGAYEVPRRKLANVIQYTDSATKINYFFEVPANAQGAKDVILVVNHMVDSQGRPLITYEDKGGNDVLIKVHDHSKIKVIEDFPGHNGWYGTDPEFGIPIGKEISFSDPDARYLWRQVKSCSYVGLIYRRPNYLDGSLRRGVCFDWLPSCSAGALGTESEAQEPSALEIKSNGQPNIKEPDVAQKLR